MELSDEDDVLLWGEIIDLWYIIEPNLDVAENVNALLKLNPDLSSSRAEIFQHMAAIRGRRTPLLLDETWVFSGNEDSVVTLLTKAEALGIRVIARWRGSRERFTP